MLPDYQHLLLERHGAVVILTMNRPEKLNAMNNLMHEEFIDALEKLDEDPESNVIVITGAGRGFCSGGDVGTMPGAGDEEALARQRREDMQVHRPGRHLLEAYLWAEKPIIAMVNGPASGLGATIALFSDVVIASNDAHFSDSHVNVGLVAGDGGSVIWPLLLGIARGKEYLMTGDRITGPDAERLGLVNHSVPAEELRDYTLRFAERLAGQPPFAVRATKAAVNRQLRRAVEDVQDLSGAWQRISLKSDEHKTAVAAFMERRKKK
jgi:enoyl-CoA hydratase